MRITIMRSGERKVSATDWVQSRHCFSFGDHYDPTNTHHGCLTVFNEEILAPRSGYELHRHRNSEIVTWIQQGTLTHRDSSGHHGHTIRGLAALMSAGSGIEHSEFNESDEPVHFIQMAVIPDESDAEPSYAVADVTEDLTEHGFVTVASGRPHHPRALPLGNRTAALHVARATEGTAIEIAVGRYSFVFVCAGTVELTAIAEADNTPISALPTTVGTFACGDSVRTEGATRLRLFGCAPGTEVLIWEMDHSLADMALMTPLAT